MKTLKTIFVTLIVITAFFSCEDDHEPVYKAQEDTDGIAFVNTFASEYLLSDEIKNNIADRLIWNKPDYGVQTNINYLIEGAIGSEFNVKTDSLRTIGTTRKTHFPLLVSNLLRFASDLGLDNKPNTTDANGLPNNSGTMYLRVKAFLGTEESPTNVTYTSSKAINIVLIEKEEAAGGGCNSLYALGDAIENVGWNFPGAELICKSDVLTAKIALKSGTFRFFQTVGDWESGLNFTYYKDAGFTIDGNFENADDGDKNFKLTGKAGIYTLKIDNQNKTITLTPSSSLWAVGDAVPGGWGFNSDTVEFKESSPDVWSATIALNNGIFRFFPTFEDWNTSYNFPYYIDNEFTIDPSFENQGESDENFKFIGTPGTYTLTIDAVNKNISLK